MNRVQLISIVRTRISGNADGYDSYALTVRSHWHVGGPQPAPIARAYQATAGSLHHRPKFISPEQQSRTLLVHDRETMATHPHADNIPTTCSWSSRRPRSRNSAPSHRTARNYRLKEKRTCTYMYACMHPSSQLVSRKET